MRAFKRERAAGWLRIVQLEANCGQSAAVMAGVEGFPVEMKDHRNGEQYGITNVANGKLSDAPFNEYKKLRKDEMPSMPDR